MKRVPIPVLTASLYERFSSRGEADYRGQTAVGDAFRDSAGIWKKPQDIRGCLRRRMS